MLNSTYDILVGSASALRRSLRVIDLMATKAETDEERAALAEVRDELLSALSRSEQRARECRPNAVAIERWQRGNTEAMSRYFPPATTPRA